MQLYPIFNIVYPAYDNRHVFGGPDRNISIDPHNIPFDPNSKKMAGSESPQCVLSPFLIAGGMMIWQF